MNVKFEGASAPANSVMAFAAAIRSHFKTEGKLRKSSALQPYRIGNVGEFSLQYRTVCEGRARRPTLRSDRDSLTAGILCKRDDWGTQREGGRRVDANSSVGGVVYIRPVLYIQEWISIGAIVEEIGAEVRKEACVCSYCIRYISTLHHPRVICTVLDPYCIYN